MMLTAPWSATPSWLNVTELLLLSAFGSSEFLYSGQAVLDGVMFRGRRSCTVAVRRPAGDTASQSRTVPTYLNPLRHVPLVRGVALFIESLTLGVWAFQMAERLAKDGNPTGGKTSLAATTGKVLASFVLAAGLFFLAPYLLAAAFPLPSLSPLTRHVVEGLFRVAILVTYIVIIGRFGQAQRAFAYHGAEHMVARAHQEGVRLEVNEIRHLPEALSWCGTTLLLVVLLVASIVFVLLGPLPRVLALTLRVALTPVIAAVSFEIMTLGGGSPKGNRLGRALACPGLLLQRLTTRRPSDDQLEVAILALRETLARDGDEEARLGG